MGKGKIMKKEVLKTMLVSTSKEALVSDSVLNILMSRFSLTTQHI